MSDISIKTDTSDFWLRAAALILRAGKVLLCHYDDRNSTAFWFFPGGKIKLNESSSDAIVREMLEEVNVTATCGSLIWITEKITRRPGISSHEIVFYLLASIPEDALQETAESIPNRDDPNVTFEWVELSALKNLELWPRFASEALNATELTFRHEIELE